MARAPSYRSSYHDPYDELDELPTYPDEQAPFPPRPRSLNVEAKKDGLAAGGPMTVDQFAYEVRPPLQLTLRLIWLTSLASCPDWPPP